MPRISDILNIRRLERENRKYLYLGGLCGVIIASAILFLTPYEYAPWKHTETYRRIVLRLIEVPAEIQPEKKELTQLQSYSDIDEPLNRILEKSPPKGTPSDFAYHDTPQSIELDTDQHTATKDLLGSELYGEERLYGLPDSDVPLSKNVIRDNGEYTFNVMVSPTNKKAVEGFVRLVLGWGKYVQTAGTSGREVIREPCRSG